MNNPSVVTRFPPSPTGAFHIGSARTALFNYLFAKHYGGKMLLRMEDTDKERSKEEYVKNILDGLSWLGIHHDGEVTYQSKRTAVYREYLELMLKNGTAFISDEGEGEGKRSSVIRYKNPNRVVTFHDEIRGNISVDTTDLGNFVLAKDMETPLYHLAVVVDDFTMAVTHVIRGEDGIANTPRQILIQEAISAPQPIYIHIPLILASDRTKLSKRHGATAVTEYREEGYLPQAIVNFLALMGWNPGTDQEIFSMDELIKIFSAEHIQKGAAIFNIEKLNWYNREYIKHIPSQTLLEFLKPHIPPAILERENWDIARFERLLPTIQERLIKFGDIHTMFEEREFQYLFELPVVTKEKLVWKDSTLEITRNHLTHILSQLEPLSPWSQQKIKEAVWDYATKEGRGAVLWPMRYALSGKEKSPDPFVLSEVLGKEETTLRITKAISALK